jgi:hypothetical protein
MNANNYLDNYKHVVHSDAEEQKGNYGMDVGVEDPHEEAGAERGRDGKSNYYHASQGEENLKRGKN